MDGGATLASLAEAQDAWKNRIVAANQATLKLDEPQNPCWKAAGKSVRQGLQGQTRLRQQFSASTAPNLAALAVGPIAFRARDR